jgi:hypothetical protein
VEDIKPLAPPESETMADLLARPVPRPRLLLLLSLAAFFFGPPQSNGSSLAQDESTTIADAIDAWLHIRPWIDELHVPPARPGELGPELTGVSLMLRFQGRIIGVGEAHDLGPETLRQAVIAAVRDARASQRVKDLPFEMIESVGSQACVEIELPLQPQPLLGETFDDVIASIRPGIDGLAVRRGTNWSWSFPGRMQAFGLAERPERVLIRLLRELGLPPKNPVELRRIDDVEFYRFKVIVLTQETPESMPFESIRGAQLVPRPMELQALARTLAEGAASNLLTHLASDPTKDVGDIPGAERLADLGLFGDYEVSNDSYKPMVAPPGEQALTAWALARYSAEYRDLPPETRSEIRRIAGLILDRLGTVDPVEQDPMADERCIPLILLSGLALYDQKENHDPELAQPPIIAKARDRFLAQIDRPEDGQPEVNLSVRALEALAACGLSRETNPIISPEKAAKMLESVWRTTAPDQLIGVLHFLILADRTLSPNPNLASHQAASQHLIEAAIVNQIGHEESLVAIELPARDLLGGFVLSGSPRATSGASSLRPALALAAATRNGLIPAPERRLAWQTSLELALRFARQLQIDETQGYRTPAPVRARGGLKSAPWSNLSRLSDTALALLLATEILADEHTSQPSNTAENRPRTSSESP